MRRHVLANSCHYLYRSGGGGGVKAILDWQFDREVYFKRGPLAKMGKAVK